MRGARIRRWRYGAAAPAPLALGDSATLVLCAVVITGLLVRRELLPPREARAETPELIREWRYTATTPLWPMVTRQRLGCSTRGQV